MPYPTLLFELFNSRTALRKQCRPRIRANPHNAEFMSRAACAIQPATILAGEDVRAGKLVLQCAARQVRGYLADQELSEVRVSAPGDFTKEPPEVRIGQHVVSVGLDLRR